MATAVEQKADGSKNLVRFVTAENITWWKQKKKLDPAKIEHG